MIYFILAQYMKDRNDRMQITQQRSEYDVITSYMRFNFMQQTTSSSSEDDSIVC